MKLMQSVLQRRSFVMQVGGRGAAFAAAAVGAGALQAQSRADRWEPERHTEDDWLDKISGKHRLVFDATMPDGFGYALLYAKNTDCKIRTERSSSWRGILPRHSPSMTRCGRSTARQSPDS